MPSIRIAIPRDVLFTRINLSLGKGGAGAPATLSLSGTAPQGINGQAYSFVPTRTGGVGPYTYNISVGSLPAWASLNTSTGAITGTSNATALTSVTLRVVSTDLQQATLPVSIDIVDSPAIPTDFDALYAGGFALRTDTTYSPSPVVARPASKAAGIASPSYTDADFGTKIFRITDVADGISGAVYMRHEYSKKQSFNCDNTMFIARGSGGHWWLYDANTFQIINGGSTIAGSVGSLGSGSTGHFSGDCEATWHPTDPNKLWRTDNLGSLTWYEFNIATKATTTLFSLSGKLTAFGLGAATRAYFGAEGRPSDDGSKFGFMLQDNAFNMIGVCMYDRTTDTVTAGLATNNKPNWVGTIPDGSGLCMSWYNNSGQTMAQCAAATLNNTDGARAYNSTLTAFVQLANRGEHADLMKDALGNMVYVSVNLDGARMPDVTDGYMFYRNITTGVATQLPINTYTSGFSSTHYSGVGVDKPGYVLVSTYGADTGTYDREVFAIELKPSSPKIYRIAHTHSDVNDYWSEPQVAADRTLTRILWASDFGTTDKFESYMAGLPAQAIPSLSAPVAAAPVNTVAPVVTGGTAAGSALTASTGTWTGYPTPTLVGYKWYKGGVLISGQTASTYTTVVGDIGATITAKSTFTNASGTVDSTASNGIVVTAAVSSPTVRASTQAGAAVANNVTSPGITTVSGDTLAVIVGWQAGGAMPVITDSKGNTYTQYGTASTTSNGGYTYSIALALCLGNVSIGGASHTFTATKTGGYPSIFPVAINGANATVPVDGYIAAADSANPFSSGDITPSSNNTLVLSAMIDYDSTGLSVAAPYAFLQNMPAPTYWAGVVSSYSQSTAAATSAAYTLTNQLPAALLTVAFKT